MKTANLLLLLLSLLFITCYSFDDENYQEPKYDHGLSKSAHDLIFNVSLRESIRIKPIYYLDWASKHVRAKIMDQLIPAAISYFEAALKVNQLPLGFYITDEDLSKYCKIRNRPDGLKEGLPADFVLFVRGDDDMSDAFAYSSPCLFHRISNRPLAGTIHYNKEENWSGMDEMTYEKHMRTTLHEIAHLIGFSINHFEYFVDPITGRVLDGVLSKKMVNGIKTQVLSLEPLNKRIREYFNCPTLEGAYLENQGGVGSQNSHFERRIFFNELMTSVHIEDARISEFTLAVLEGSGWYTPNYSMAEPLFWGKGKGCAFLDQKCITSSRKTRFNGFFCDQRGEKGCSFSGFSKGYCGGSSSDYDNDLNPEFDYFNDQQIIDDPSADNCPYFVDRVKDSCYNPKNANDRTIDGEFYGAGSRCFSGTLHKEEADLDSYTNLYCIKQSCKKLIPGDFRLELEIDESVYTCSDGGSIQVKGYKGHLDCPRSVNEYCSTTSLKYCKRGCMGRGRCVDGECICDEGFEGLGCSIITALYPSSPEWNMNQLVLSLFILSFFIIYGAIIYKRKPQAEQSMHYSVISPTLENASSMTIPIASSFEGGNTQSKPFIEMAPVQESIFVQNPAKEKAPEFSSSSD